MSGVEAYLTRFGLDIKRLLETMQYVRGIGVIFFMVILAVGLRAASFGSIPGFGDPQLTALVKESLKVNGDPRTATIDLKSALASAEKARADLLSIVPLDPAPPLGAAFDIAWETEVWDRLTMSSFPDAVRQSLAGQTAKAWFLAVTTKMEWDMAKRILFDREQVAQVVQAQFKNGEVTEEEAAAAKAKLARAQQNVLKAESAFREAARTVESLLGRYPLKELQAADSLKAVLPPIPGGLPSAMLERRPDLIATARQVVAAFAKTKPADPHVAALFLTELGGGPSLGLLDLLEGGMKPVELGQTNGAQRAAVALYEKTAWNAFREVGAALKRETALQNQEESLLRSAVESQTARQVVESRYKRGAAPLTDVLNVELEEFDTRSAILVIHAARLSNRVNLYLALGPVQSPSNSSNVRPFVSGTNFQTNQAAKSPIAP